MITVLRLLLIIIPYLEYVHGNLYRLPAFVKPSFYSLTIHPDFYQGNYSGKVYIDVQVEVSTNSIQFHSANLTIHKLYLDQTPVDYKLIPEYEIIEIFHVNKTEVIPHGAHKIQIEFEGSLLNKELGLFKTSYSINGTIFSELIASDTEPTFARSIFPCFDEPALKAKFKVSLLVPNENYTALSNMEQKHKFKTQHGIFYKFKTSPPMSTYVLSLAVTSYSFVEEVARIRDKEIPIRIYSHSCLKENTAKILEFAAKCLEFYTEYFNYSYPLGKIDLIEYDRNLSVATENWGLITFQKGYLQPGLINNVNHAEIIAHELAHYWFGNLVTNDWWSDIWLQESFAQYLAVKAESAIFNNSDTVQAFGLENALFLDEENATNPVVNEVQTPLEIRNHFSDITYEKGAALLQMTNILIGEDTFQKVLREYIHRFKFQSATTNDLLNIIDEFDESAYMREFLESYLYQSHYPVINAEEDDERYILTQMSYLFKQNTSKTAFDEYKWTIPVTYITSERPSNYTLVWFDKNADNLIIPKKNETWIKFNFKHVGYYRVNYSESLWDKIVIHAKEIDTFEKRHLVVEAAKLFEKDFVSCERTIKANSFEKTRVRRTFAISLVNDYLKEQGLKQYDEDAYSIFRGYWNLLESNGTSGKYEKYTIPANPSNQTKSQEVRNVSIATQKCSVWIKQGLEKYIDDLIQLINTSALNET